MENVYINKLYLNNILVYSQMDEETDGDWVPFTFAAAEQNVHIKVKIGRCGGKEFSPQYPVYTGWNEKFSYIDFFYHSQGFDSIKRIELDINSNLKYTHVDSDICIIEFDVVKTKDTNLIDTYANFIQFSIPCFEVNTYYHDEYVSGDYNYFETSTAEDDVILFKTYTSADAYSTGFTGKGTLTTDKPNDTIYLSDDAGQSLSMNIVRIKNMEPDSLYITNIDDPEGLLLWTGFDTIYKTEVSGQTNTYDIKTNFRSNPNTLNHDKTASFVVNGVSINEGKLYSFKVYLTQAHNEWFDYMTYNDKTISPVEQNFDVEVLYDPNQIGFSDIYISEFIPIDSDWCTINGYRVEDVPGSSWDRLVINMTAIAQDEDGEERSAIIALDMVGIMAYIKVKQEAYVPTFKYPSWMDPFVTIYFGVGDKIWKNIKITSDMITDETPDVNILYEGKIWNAGNNSTEINLKEVLANNVSVEWGTGNGYYHLMQNQLKTMYLYTDNVLTNIFEIYYDYSFEPRLLNDPATYPYLQENIFNKVDPRQVVFTSIINAPSTGPFSTIFGYKHGDTYDAVNSSSPLSNGAVTYSVNASTLSDGDVPFFKANAAGTPNTVLDNFRVICEGNKYKYALYYLNKRGGWDWLLLNDASYVTSNKTSHTYTIEGDNPHSVNNPINRQIIPYMNNTKKTWTVFTDLFNGVDKLKVKTDGTTTKVHYTSEQQMKLMDNVFSSKQLYLHDFEENLIYAVNLDDSQMVFKTINQNGGKLFNCKLQLSQAQNRYTL